MGLRRRKLVDRKFQLKTVFSIVGIALGGFLVLIAVIGVNVTHGNRVISHAVTSITSAADTERNTIEAARQKLAAIDNREIKKIVSPVLTSHKKTLEAVRTETGNLTRHVRHNFILISIMLLLAIALCVILYVYVLNLTHRIAGPLYVMSRHIHDVLEGKNPEIRDLRGRDELKDFYKEFTDLIERFRENGE